MGEALLRKAEVLEFRQTDHQTNRHCTMTHWSVSATVCFAVYKIFVYLGPVVQNKIRPMNQDFGQLRFHLSLETGPFWSKKQPP